MRYRDIGPFEGVPEDARAVSALAASRASEAALTAALRQSEEVGDTSRPDFAIFPAVAAANSAWRTVEKADAHDLEMTYPDYLLAFRVPLVLAAIGATILCLYLCPAASVHRDNAFGAGFAFLGVAAIVFVVGSLSGGRHAKRVRKEKAARGFVGDHLSRALRAEVGKCWALGGKALHLGYGDGKARSIFFDAIGHVSVTVDDGIENVCVFGRDGVAMCSMAAPEGLSGLSPSGIATRLLELGHAARAASPA
jgi:hypothetical protein